jgi:predicted alpha/beta-hydrolase family hydrolase
VGGADETEALRLAVGSAGEVSALWSRPDGAWAVLALAHGAGAGMRHPFMEATAAGLGARGVATLRFQFPYMEAGSRRPDAPPVLTACVRSAAACAAERAGELPLFAGGKSLGGRMTSTAAAQQTLPGVRGLVFLGFPLHPAGAPATARAAHLRELALPLLFLQGTRDALADLALLRPLCDELGPRATLHEIAGGDHSFHVPKRSGRSDADALNELCDAACAWMRAL